MAVYCRLGDQQVNADDLAAELLAEDLAKDARAAMAVVRNGDDYVIVRNDQRHIAAGQLIKVCYVPTTDPKHCHI